MRAVGWKPKRRYPENCVVCLKIGAISRGHSYIDIRGVPYPICYRHTQILCGKFKPEKDEEYLLKDLNSLGVSGTFPTRKPKTYPTIVIEIPDTRDVPTI